MADDFDAALENLIKLKSSAVSPEGMDALAEERARALQAKADAAVVNQRRAGRSTTEELTRQVGLTARAAGPAAAGAVMGGAMGAPFGPAGVAAGALGGAAIGGVAMPVADLAVSGYNYATGKNVGLPSRAFERVLTQAGLPEPETPTERVVQGTSRAMIDAATGASAARTFSQMVPRPQGVPASPGAAVVDQMARNPSQQITSAGVGSAAAGTAVENGAGPLTAMAIGIGAGSLPYMARPGAVLPAASPEQQRLLGVLDQAGVPTTPAQRSSSPFGRVFESVLKYLPTSATRSAAVEDNQLRAWTRSWMQRAGLNAETADPAELSTLRRGFQQGYADLEQRTQFGPDRPFVSDLAANDARYARGFSDNVRALYNQRLNELVNFVRQGPAGAQVDGSNYHALQSQLAEEARSAMRSTEPSTRAYGQAMQGLSAALERLMERQAGPGLADEWRDINRRYAVFSLIEDTMAQAGQEKLRTGYIPPQALGSQMRMRDPRAWVEERSPDVQLARAGVAILPDPVPNSGTAQRSYAQNLATGFSNSWPTAAAGAGAAGLGIGTAAAGAAALAGPYAASRMWYGRNYTLPEAAMIGSRAIEGASDEGLLGPRDTIRRRTNGAR